MEQLKFEQKDKPVSSFTTEKGSVYSYLEDGRIERYKKVTDEYLEPSNAIVFIPTWEWISTHAPKDFLDRFENQLIFEQEMLGYIHSEEKNVYIVDKNGSKLDDQEKIKTAENVYLYFGTKQGVDFVIPVQKDPQIGYKPFDTTKYETAEGWKRRRHIGSSIIEINHQV